MTRSAFEARLVQHLFEAVFCSLAVMFLPVDPARSEAVVGTRPVIYRWDLDKTYLRTEFDTFRDLLRTAFESPDRKKTVPGAGALLRELCRNDLAGVFILSGSPEQMRRVLEAKLRLDGIHWDSFTLKPSLQNLLRGRFRFLKDQVYYKLTSLLSSRAGCDPQTAEVLFGDDAEADAFIYSLYADLCAGRVGNDTLMAVLRRARVYEDEVPRIVRMASNLPRGDSVRRILIHLDRTSSPEMFAEFGPRVVPFYNYFQAALCLVDDGMLTPDAALRVGVQIVIQHAFTPDALIASFMELAERECAFKETAEQLLMAAPPVSERYAADALQEFMTGLEEHIGTLPARTSMEDVSPTHSAEDRPVLDYVDLFSRDSDRARAARRRAKWRPKL